MIENVRIKKKYGYKQGRFNPKNPSKYVGKSVSEIVYRSSWELKVMIELDTNPAILLWSSEEVVVPYIDRRYNPPRARRYLPDFVIKKRGTDGVERIQMIEIKPDKERRPSKSKNRKRMIEENLTYVNNVDTWNAALAFCKEKGWDFIVLTEKELGIK